MAYHRQRATKSMTAYITVPVVTIAAVRYICTFFGAIFPRLWHVYDNAEVRRITVPV
jgi:hypothetical protein